MKPPLKHDLEEITRHFPLQGKYIGAEPYGTGHINDTYITRWDVNGKEAIWLQQRINHNVFKDPPKLMENILRVTHHLQQRLSAIPGTDPKRETLNVIPARDGKPFHRDAEGNYWRTYVFISGARTYDVCQGPDQAFAAAAAFARFQQLLVDLPGGRLYDTIPFFHHTPRRFAALEEALKKDGTNRAASVQEELDFAFARREMTPVITDMLEKGEIPERITHNDTKLNNVMIDDVTGEGISVIDLDTVMSGTVLYDFGDMVRTSACSSPEDERDLATVTFRQDMFEALVRGYMEHGAAFLTPVEVKYLAFSARLITFTIGIRFLADHLMGDVYFKTHRPGHNLDRARVQFKMVENMEVAADRMEAIVQRCRSG